MMDSQPKFLQGVYPFTGRGMASAFSLSPELTYLAPADKRTQLIYFRCGNSSGELICLVLMRDGKPMRYFPVGAKDSVHVPLAVVEDLFPETRLEVFLAAPEGVSGEVVLDIGLMEV